MADTETVGLNFSGAAPALAADAAAADKLTAAFDKLGAASAKVKAPQGNDAGRMSAITSELEQQAALEAKIATFDAQRVRNVAALEAKYKSMKDAALGVKPPAANDNGGASFKGLEGMGGSSILGGAVALGAGATLAMEAGKAILNAAIELGKSAIELTAAGVKLSVEESSKKELQSFVLKTLGGDFDATIHLAAKYGIDEGKAIAEVKGLLQAGFSQHAIELDVKIAAAMDLVKGEGTGAAYLEHLEKMSLKPKVDAKDIKSLAGLGLDTKKVYEELAKSLGTSVPEAMAKVKAGAVDTEKVLAAVEKVGEDSFGKLADQMGNSVPALLMRVRSDFAHLFDSVDLTPVKDVLKNIASAFEGPAGGALKVAVTELFGAINHAFLDQFKGEEGKAKIEQFMKAAAAAVHELSEAVTKAKPLIDALTDEAGGTLIFVLRDVAQAITIVTGAVEILTPVVNALAAVVEIVISPITNLIAAIDILSGSVSGAANSIGANVDQGMADGMQGGAALAAAEAMAEGVLATVRGVFDQHSPSREFGKIGAANDVGMAQPMAEGTASEAAGAKMARKALDAANGEDGEGGAAGGRSGGRGGAAGGSQGGDTYIFQITPAPGTTDEQSDEISEKSYRKFQAHKRRDARERAA